MNKVFVLFALFLCTSLTAATEGALHALLICDTGAASKLYQAYQIDLDHMKKEVEGIAFQSNLQLDMKVCTGKAVRSWNIKKWVSLLPASSNDVVLVYYVGREGPSQKTKGKWPSIMPAVKKKKNCISAFILAKAIQKRHPRLTLVFFDCYDRLMKISEHHMTFENWDIPTEDDYTEVKPLFVEAKGTFIACSGKRGQKNFSIVQNKKTQGGVFTYALIESIGTETFQPSWESCVLTLKDEYELTYESKHKRPLIYRRLIEPSYPPASHWSASTAVQQ